MEAVAGTGGITAAVDAIWHLKRKSGNDATLEVVGREIEERTFALTFNRDTPFGWHFAGDANSVALSAEREEILELLRNEGPLRPAQIASQLHKNPNTVRALVQRLHNSGHVSRDEDGCYLPIER